MSKIMGGGGNWITMYITKFSLESEERWTEAPPDTAAEKKFNIVPICYHCNKAPYYSKKETTSGWCKLVSDNRGKVQDVDAITEWDSDTKLKGIEMIDLSKENEKCSTGKAANEWIEDNVIDLKGKLSKQIECLNFFVCNSCDKIKKTGN